MAHVNIDRTAPDVEVGGDLHEFAAQPLTGDTYDVWLDATDVSGSEVLTAGVKSVELRLNGTRVANAEAPCDGADCDLDVSWDFLREEHPPGHYEVSATAVDWAGNVATDSFSFDLSADRTPDPADEGAFTAPTMAGLATGDDDMACAAWAHRFGLTGARDVQSRTTAMGLGETTIAYGDGRYVTIRCDRDGGLVEAQRVGPIVTPEGPRMVPESRTARSRSGMGYTTSYPSYDDPRNPRHARTWRRDVDRLAAHALPPTSGVQLTRPASGVAITAAEEDTVCGPDTEPEFETHAWGGATWRYYIDRSSFPITFNRFVAETVSKSVLEMESGPGMKDGTGVATAS
jgi:hypothetical protein